MEQSLPTPLPLAAVEARRREIRVQFLDHTRRLRAVEKMLQYLLMVGEIFEDLEHDADWYFKEEPELVRDIAELRAKARSLVLRLNLEMDAMINTLWNRFGPPASESVAAEPETASFRPPASESVAPEPETVSS
eukprot:symbB.v1.2.012529.t1/scaffold852.1/size193270/7